MYFSFFWKNSDMYYIAVLLFISNSLQATLIPYSIQNSAATVDGYQWKSGLCSSEPCNQSLSEGSPRQYIWKWYAIFIIVLFSANHVWSSSQPLMQLAIVQKLQKGMSFSYLNYFSIL